MSSVANPLAEGWNALRSREIVDAATRIFGLWSANATPFYVFVLRPYADAVVEAVPDPAVVLERFPHAQVELLVRPGQRLSENDHDVASHRLALVALAAPTREAVLARYQDAKRLLPFDLRPITRGSARGSASLG